MCGDFPFVYWRLKSEFIGQPLFSNGSFFLEAIEKSTKKPFLFYETSNVRKIIINGRERWKAIIQTHFFYNFP